MDKEIFVQNIKKCCIAQNIKPTVACKEAGVGGSFISDINRGQVPSVAKVQSLAAYLGVTTSELLGEEKRPDSSETVRRSKKEEAMLEAYRAADPRAQEMVRLALAPWLPSAEHGSEAM